MKGRNRELGPGMFSKRGRVVTLATLVMLAVLASGCTGEMSADEIASKAQEKNDAVESIRANFSTEISGPNGPTEFEVSVWREGNKSRMEYLGPPEKRGDVVVRDGGRISRYDESENSLRVVEALGRTDPSTDFDSFVKNMVERYSFSLQGTEEVAGRECYVLKLRPKEEAGKAAEVSGEQRVWVDKEYWKPLKIISISSLGNRTVESKTVFTYVEYNVEIPESKFELEVPENTTVEEQSFRAPKTFESPGAASKEAGFEVVTPETPPEGYSLEGVRVVYFRQEPTAILTYRNESEVLTISETRANRSIAPDLNGSKVGDLEEEKVELENGEATYRSTGPYYILAWSCGDLTLTIGGGTGKEEMMEIANSVDCS